jgi:hypothetical protein
MASFWTWILLLTGLLILFSVLAAYFWWKARQEKQYQAKFPGSYICKDGHKVRSLSELAIDNFFTDHLVQHEYEQPILPKADRNFKYDWYLPEIDIYLEFFGFHGRTYFETRKTKEKFYKAAKLHMIAIEPMDLARLEESIPAKLGSDWTRIARYPHCPHCGEQLEQRY